MSGYSTHVTFSTLHETCYVPRVHNFAKNCKVTVYIYIYIYITPPAQVAQCQDHLGYKYRSGMQQPNTGSTRARSALWWCPCASCIWLLHPAPILVPKMVLTLCNLRWWCFSFHQLAKILHLHSWWSSLAATLRWWCFSLEH